MHLLNTLPQRLDPGATPTFAGLVAPSLTSPAATNLTLAGGSSGASLVLGQGANGAATITPAGTGDINLTASASGSFVYVNAGNPILFINETDQSVDARLWGMQSEGGLFKLRAFNDALSSAVDTFAATRTGNLLIGTTTDMSGTGGLTVAGTTAGSSGAGALVVTGGLSAGGASYFGGGVSIEKGNGGNPNGPTNAAIYLSVDESTIQGPSTNTNIRMGGNLILAAHSYWFAATNGTTALTISNTQAATFAGAVTVSSSTAGSASAGALVVTGGLSAGNNGNASYFGGAVIVAQDKFSNFDGSGAARMGIQAVSVAPYSVRMLGSADAANTRDFSFGYYTSDNAANAWNQKAAINSYTGAATFAGTVSANSGIYPYTAGNGSGLITQNGAAGGLYFANQGISTNMRFLVTDGAAASVLALTLSAGTGAATFAGAVTVGGALKLANAYVAGAAVGTGTITIQDSTGTTYRIPVLV